MSETPTGPRAEIRLGALRANLRAVAEVVETPICAVVKADAYGHGAAAVARAALEAGAQWLAVASAAEACSLGGSVPSGTPILVLSQRLGPELEALADDLPEGIRLSVSNRSGIAEAARLARPDRPIRVHLAVDTGMRREGAEPAQAPGLAEALVENPSLHWEGTWTHMACADLPADPYTGRQLDIFDEVLAGLRAAGFDPGIAHAANSAAALGHPRSRHDLVRIGIAMYGVAPSHETARLVDLKPVMRLIAPVAELRSIAEGETVSYGRRFVALAPELIATLPIGYADGIRRSAGILGVDVLIGGVRCPIVGNVTMDHTMAAVPPGTERGDECVLLGASGDEAISATEIAERLGTIGYEVLVAVGARVRRVLIDPPARPGAADQPSPSEPLHRADAQHPAQSDAQEPTL